MLNELYLNYLNRQIFNEYGQIKCRQWYCTMYSYNVWSIDNVKVKYIELYNILMYVMS